ncbi:MFS transporter [Candidatus Aerophobetes bacterium]|nr:MFS transporter [Candidatus Aerophobetes bacterium]
MSFLENINMSKISRKLNKDFEKEVKKHYRWNFTVNVMDAVLFWFGMGFASVNTILPAFLRHLTSSNFLIGLVVSLSTLGWFLPQIFSVNYIQKFKRRKDVILRWGLGERVPWLFISLLVFYFSEYFSPLFLIIFLVLYAICVFSGGIQGPAWLDMLAKVIPLKKRGEFFGWSNFLGGGTGMFAGFLSIYILRKYPFPSNFSLCFLITFVATSISYGFVVSTREPVYPIEDNLTSLKEYFSKIPHLLKGDKNFSSFLLVNILLSFGGMATAFFAVYALNRLALPDSQIGVFTALILGAQTISSLLWGYLGDRRGYKLIVEISILSTILASLIAIFSSSLYLFYIVFILTGCSFSAGMISGQNIVLEFSTPRMRPTYIALTNTFKAPFIGLSPLLGGAIADRFSFPLVFLLTALILSSGFLLLKFLVQEPRHLPPYQPRDILPRRI